MRYFAYLLLTCAVLPAAPASKPLRVLIIDGQNNHAWQQTTPVLKKIFEGTGTFTADVATMRARRFSGWGEAGYQTSIFICLARFRRRPFPLSVDDEPSIDRRPCLFLTFNNSKFTGGTMMIAPDAATDDGLIEYVRWGPIGRVGLIRNLSTLYDGTHTRHPLAEVRKVRRVDFHLDRPVDVMVDGEVITLHCESLDVLPGALNVVV